VQRTGSVTAEHPARFRFGAMGTGTRLAFPLGTVFGEPWIHLGAHCIIGEQVTLTAGLMPDLDLGPDPILRIGDGVVLGRGSHVIADTTVTIGSDCYFGPYVYVTSTNHSYDDPREPIGKQWPRMEPVEIGPGCWIGTGAVILPGARIGRNVVVAAGAVVRGRTALDARGRLAAAAEDPAPGPDPGRRHAGPAAGAGRTGRGGRRPARRAGDGILSQPLASSTVPTRARPAPAACTARSRSLRKPRAASAVTTG
jgi:serine acetyltransferase